MKKAVLFINVLLLMNVVIFCAIIKWLGNGRDAQLLKKPRVSHGEIRELCVEGASVQPIFDQFGEPHYRGSSNPGEKLLYRTFVDWDKFEAHWIIWIETDESGQIINTFIALDPD